jgi:hypothetical protein
MIIQEYLTRLTKYRDNLLITVKRSLKYTKPELDDTTDTKRYRPLRPSESLKIIEEIELTNKHLDNLHAWNTHYNGDTIPIDNTEIYKSVEEFLNRN